MTTTLSQVTPSQNDKMAKCWCVLFHQSQKLALLRAPKCKINENKWDKKKKKRGGKNQRTPSPYLSPPIISPFGKLVRPGNLLRSGEVEECSVCSDSSSSPGSLLTVGNGLTSSSSSSLSSSSSSSEMTGRVLIAGSRVSSSWIPTTQCTLYSTDK